MTSEGMKYTLFTAIIKGKNGIVMEALSNDDFDLDTPLNKFQWTPLHTASYSGDAELVTFLLKNGAKRDLKNESGYTARMLAEYKGYDEIVELLGTEIADEDITTIGSSSGEVL